MINPKKFYFIDTGLINALTPKFIFSYGLLLENSIFLELIRRGYEVYYLKEQYEVDFIAIKDDQIKTIQVSYDVSDTDTFERETKSLKSAKKILPEAELVLISSDFPKKIFPLKKTKLNSS